jgi:hypothetical protein
MIQASIAGNEKNDSAMMQRLFNEIGDPVRVAALNKAIIRATRFCLEQSLHRNHRAGSGERMRNSP